MLQIVAINIDTPPGSSSQRIISILQVCSHGMAPSFGCRWLASTSPPPREAVPRKSSASCRYGHNIGLPAFIGKVCWHVVPYVRARLAQPEKVFILALSRPLHRVPFNSFWPCPQLSQTLGFCTFVAVSCYSVPNFRV